MSLTVVALLDATVVIVFVIRTLCRVPATLTALAVPMCRKTAVLVVFVFFGSFLCCGGARRGQGCGLTCSPARA